MYGFDGGYLIVDFRDWSGRWCLTDAKDKERNNGALQIIQQYKRNIGIQIHKLLSWSGSWWSRQMGLQKDNNNEAIIKGGIKEEGYTDIIME